MAKRGAKKTETPSMESAYVDYLLSHGKRPVSVHRFCKDLGMKESDFYKVAASFAALEAKIWSRQAEETIHKLRADKDFASFSAREKMLAFHYTLMESLNQNRSFMLMTGQLDRIPGAMPPSLKGFRKHFEDFAGEIMAEAKASGEVAARPWLDSRYPSLFSLHLQMQLRFWATDESTGFERTDAFIEKSVNLAFDLISKGAIDSAIDFAKFIFQAKSAS